MQQFKTVNEYIARVPKVPRLALKKLRAVIKKAAPNTTEAISYGIPTFKYKGKNLVHFGAFSGHYSFFPGGIVKKYSKELKSFKTSKGTIQLEYLKPLPSALITKIVKERMKMLK